MPPRKPLSPDPELMREKAATLLVEKESMLHSMKQDELQKKKMESDRKKENAVQKKKFQRDGRDAQKDLSKKENQLNRTRRLLEKTSTQIESLLPKRQKEETGIQAKIQTLDKKAFELVVEKDAALAEAAQVQEKLQALETSRKLLDDGILPTEINQPRKSEVEENLANVRQRLAATKNRNEILKMENDLLHQHKEDILAGLITADDPSVLESLDMMRENETAYHCDNESPRSKIEDMSPVISLNTASSFNMLRDRKTSMDTSLVEDVSRENETAHSGSPTSRLNGMCTATSATSGRSVSMLRGRIGSQNDVSPVSSSGALSRPHRFSSNLPRFGDDIEVSAYRGTISRIPDIAQTSPMCVSGDIDLTFNQEDMRHAQNSASPEAYDQALRGAAQASVAASLNVPLEAVVICGVEQTSAGSSRVCFSVACEDENQRAALQTELASAEFKEMFDDQFNNAARAQTDVALPVLQTENLPKAEAGSICIAGDIDLTFDEEDMRHAQSSASPEAYDQALRNAAQASVAASLNVPLEAVVIRGVEQTSAGSSRVRYSIACEDEEQRAMLQTELASAEFKEMFDDQFNNATRTQTDVALPVVRAENVTTTAAGDNPPLPGSIYVSVTTGSELVDGGDVGMKAPSCSSCSGPAGVSGDITLTFSEEDMRHAQSSASPEAYDQALRDVAQASVAASLNIPLEAVVIHDIEQTSAGSSRVRYAIACEDKEQRAALQTELESAEFKEMFENQFNIAARTQTNVALPAARTGNVTTAATGDNLPLAVGHYVSVTTGSELMKGDDMGVRALSGLSSAGPIGVSGEIDLAFNEEDMRCTQNSVSPEAYDRALRGAAQASVAASLNVPLEAVVIRGVEQTSAGSSRVCYSVACEDEKQQVILQAELASAEFKEMFDNQFNNAARTQTDVALPAARTENVTTTTTGDDAPLAVGHYVSVTTGSEPMKAGDMGVRALSGLSSAGPMEVSGDIDLAFNEEDMRRAQNSALPEAFDQALRDAAQASVAASLNVPLEAVVIRGVEQTSAGSLRVYYSAVCEDEKQRAVLQTELASAEFKEMFDDQFNNAARTQTDVALPAVRAENVTTTAAGDNPPLAVGHNVSVTIESEPMKVDDMGLRALPGSSLAGPISVFGDIDLAFDEEDMRRAQNSASPEAFDQALRDAAQASVAASLNVPLEAVVICGVKHTSAGSSRVCYSVACEDEKQQAVLQTELASAEFKEMLHDQFNIAARAQTNVALPAVRSKTATTSVAGDDARSIGLSGDIDLTFNEEDMRRAQNTASPEAYTQALCDAAHASVAASLNVPLEAVVIRGVEHTSAASSRVCYSVACEDEKQRAVLQAKLASAEFKEMFDDQFNNVARTQTDVALPNVQAGNVTTSVAGTICAWGDIDLTFSKEDMRHAQNSTSPESYDQALRDAAQASVAASLNVPLEAVVIRGVEQTSAGSSRVHYSVACEDEEQRAALQTELASAEFKEMFDDQFKNAARAQANVALHATQADNITTSVAGDDPPLPGSHSNSVTTGSEPMKGGDVGMKALSGSSFAGSISVLGDIDLTFTAENMRHAQHSASPQAFEQALRDTVQASIAASLSVPLEAVVIRGVEQTSAGSSRVCYSVACEDEEQRAGLQAALTSAYFKEIFDDQFNNAARTQTDVALPPVRTGNATMAAVGDDSRKKVKSLVSVSGDIDLAFNAEDMRCVQNSAAPETYKQALRDAAQASIAASLNVPFEAVVIRDVEQTSAASSRVRYSIACQDEKQRAVLQAELASTAFKEIFDHQFNNAARAEADVALPAVRAENVTTTVAASPASHYNSATTGSEPITGDRVGLRALPGLSTPGSISVSGNIDLTLNEEDMRRAQNSASPEAYNQALRDAAQASIAASLNIPLDAVAIRDVEQTSAGSSRVRYSIVCEGEEQRATLQAALASAEFKETFDDQFSARPQTDATLSAMQAENVTTTMAGDNTQGHGVHVEQVECSPMSSASVGEESPIAQRMLESSKGRPRSVSTATGHVLPSALPAAQAESLYAVAGGIQLDFSQDARDRMLASASRKSCALAIGNAVKLAIASSLNVSPTTVTANSTALRGPGTDEVMFSINCGNAETKKLLENAMESDDFQSKFGQRYNETAATVRNVRLPQLDLAGHAQRVAEYDKQMGHDVRGSLEQYKSPIAYSAMQAYPASGVHAAASDAGTGYYERLPDGITFPALGPNGRPLTTLQKQAFARQYRLANLGYGAQMAQASQATQTPKNNRIRINVKVRPTQGIRPLYPRMIGSQQIFGGQAASYGVMTQPHVQQVQLSPQLHVQQQVASPQEHNAHASIDPARLRQDHALKTYVQHHSTS